MSEFRNMSLTDRAKYLVERKGEMSVELWNDRAQCTLAPMMHENAKLQARIAVLEKVMEAAEIVTEHFDFYGETPKICILSLKEAIKQTGDGE